MVFLTDNKIPKEKFDNLSNKFQKYNKIYIFEALIFSMDSENFISKMEKIMLETPSEKTLKKMEKFVSATLVTKPLYIPLILGLLGIGSVYLEHSRVKDKESYMNDYSKIVWCQEEFSSELPGRYFQKLAGILPERFAQVKDYSRIIIEKNNGKMKGERKEKIDLPCDVKQKTGTI